MTRFAMSAPIGGSVDTVDGSPVTVCSYNLSNGQGKDSNHVGLPLDNTLVHIQALLLGKSQAGWIRLYGERSFARQGGVTSPLDNEMLSPLTNFLSPALSGAAMVLDHSDDVIRQRAVGLDDTGINWTGYLWLFSGEFVG